MRYAAIKLLLTDMLIGHQRCKAKANAMISVTPCTFMIFAAANPRTGGLQGGDYHVVFLVIEYATMQVLLT